MPRDGMDSIRLKKSSEMSCIMREVLLCPANDIPRLGSKVFMVNGISIAVFRSRDKFYAIENVCAHMGGPVGEGFLDGEGKNISCPWHGHSFNIKTGEIGRAHV